MPPSKRLSDDCFLHDKDRLRHSEALQILRSRLRPIAGFETVPLSYGEVTPVTSPVFSTAAMTAVTAARNSSSVAVRPSSFAWTSTVSLAGSSMPASSMMCAAVLVSPLS